MKRRMVLTAISALALCLVGCPGLFGAFDNPKDPGSSAYLSPSKSILSFSFPSPGAAGIIDEGTKTIQVTVPFGTDVTGLVAVFNTTGDSVRVGSTPQTSGATGNDFSGPVVYTVVAEDSTTAEYTVTVTVALNTAKEITSFGFSAPAVSGIINEGPKTISVTVPYGTDITSLVATFYTTGAVVEVGSTIQTSGVTTNDYTDPVVYKVTAVDGSSAVYTVTVTVALNSAKAITAFSILIPSATGVINEGAKTISVTVPYGTSRTALVAAFTTTGTIVRIGSTTQVSGVTVNNFSSSKTYTVTAANGSTANYTVTVTVALNPAKAITSFGFASPSSTGIINETEKTIDVTVPYGTNITSLRAVFMTTGSSVKIGLIQQYSGSTINNFTNPITYTVHAADGSTTDYLVTVRIALNTAKSITAFSFTSPNISGLINETRRSIMVLIPNTINRSNLTAVFSTSGVQVKVGSTIQQSGITINDFSAPVIYRVEAEDGTFADYEVYVGDALSVTLFAGGPGNIGHADGVGTSAYFDWVDGITSDGENLYVADSLNYIIRKVNIATKAVTTLAGTAGLYGNADGIGSAARFEAPVSVCCIGDYLYVGDSDNHTIRKIDLTTREVTTIAGVNSPYGLTHSGSYLYITASADNTIRKLNINTHEVTILAGTSGSPGSTDGLGSSARFSFPTDLTFVAGYLFVSDTSNHTIRKVDVNTGEVTTVAGTPGVSGDSDGTGTVARFFEPVGITSDGSFLYVTEFRNRIIRRISISTGEVRTVAGLPGSQDAYTPGSGNSARFEPRRIVNVGSGFFMTSDSSVISQLEW